MGGTTNEAVRTKSRARVWSLGLLILAGFAAVALMALALEVAGLEPRNSIVPPPVLAGVVFFSIVLGGLFASRWRDMRVERHLRAHGTRGMATILSLRDTGSRVNKQPIVELRLQIEAPGLGSYEALHRVVVSVIEAPRVQPGASLKVFVDRNDRRSMLLVV